MNSKRKEVSDRSLDIAGQALDYIEACLPEASVKDLIAAFTASSRVHKELNPNGFEGEVEKVRDPLEGYYSKLDEMVSKLASSNK